MNSLLPLISTLFMFLFLQVVIVKSDYQKINIFHNTPNVQVTDNLPRPSLSNSVQSNLIQQCAKLKLFHPQNYLESLPSLSMPYVPNVPIPVMPSRISPSLPQELIKPSPVITTKVINIVTKFVYRNPVCIKYTKKGMCTKEKKKNRNDMNELNNLQHVVTKEITVKDVNNNSLKINELKHQNYGYTEKNNFKENSLFNKTEDSSEKHSKINTDEKNVKKLEEKRLYDEVRRLMVEEDEDTLYLQSTEDPRPFMREFSATPVLSQKQITDMLIEDRLDQLETILPHYTRRRVFQTSTITVTRVRSNNLVTATLLARNCMPKGYDLCPKTSRSTTPKTQQRKSKVAQFTNSSLEQNYFG